MRDYVKKAEDLAIKKLDEFSNRAESKLKDVLKMDPEIESEYKNWEDRSFGLILKTE